jgi:HAD superfamily hydrolase (TIGR01484 family)
MGCIRLVAVDLDGTLLTSAGVLAPRGAESLSQASRAGIHVVLATTRLPKSVQRFARALGIADPVICTNGAEVWGSPDGPVWAHRTIPRRAALAIAKLADRNRWEVSTTVGAMTYWRQRSGQPLGRVAPGRTVVGSNEKALVGDPVRMLVHQPAAIEAVEVLCRTGFSDVCYAETYYRPDGMVHSLGVFALGADKGTALLLVRERLGVEREQVLAIGDNPNDLAMFRQAGVSVAMGNAPTALKEQADVVAPSNDVEGVAWAVREVLGRHGRVVDTPA